MSLLITHIKELVTLQGVAQKGGIRPKKGDLNIINNASILIQNKKIRWVGKTAEVKKKISGKIKTVSARGMVVFPGLVDPHTHLIFSGSRHKEFSWRCEGKSYLKIAKQGGGILSTAQSTQKAPLKKLIELGLKRIKKAQSFGITTLEVKSGYGLSFKDELKCLTAISRLQKQNSSMKIIPTFLGAHAFPSEYKNKKEAYVSLLCEKLIPEISQKNLARYCDVFIEDGFYTPSQAKKILTAAQKHGLKIRIHADEFKPLGGTELAVSMGAQSVDHLIAIDSKGIQALSTSQTVATLLPGTSFFLGRPFAPARKLIDSGVVVALGTDFNPGTCMTQNLALISTIAATQMKMTIPEVISAITYNAAKSLGLQNEIGSIEVGKVADLAFFEIPSYEYLPYHFGDNFCRGVIESGRPVSIRERPFARDPHAWGLFS